MHAAFVNNLTYCVTLPYLGLHVLCDAKTYSKIGLQALKAGLWILLTVKPHARKDDEDAGPSPTRIQRSKNLVETVRQIGPYIAI